LHILDGTYERYKKNGNKLDERMERLILNGVKAPETRFFVDMIAHVGARRPPRRCRSKSLARAKANDTTAYHRRKPSFSRQQFDRCKRSRHRYDERQRDLSHVGLQRMAVAHIKAGAAAAEAMLAKLGPVSQDS
jgi:hypothetical protein